MAPSTVFTVIIAVPAVTPFTTPVLVTVATFALLLVQVTAAVLCDGVSEAVRVAEAPWESVRIVLEVVRPVAGVGGTRTKTCTQ